MENNGLYPRDLRPLERELLLWVLPEDRLGYREYRDLMKTCKVISQGRRGEGNYILAPEGRTADNDSPLPRVLAFGVVATTTGEISVTVRERLGDQVEFEISSPQGEGVTGDFDEVRRWTFSTWFPSQPCPICSYRVREIHMKTRRGHHPVLAICAVDHRVWIHDEPTGVNHENEDSS